MGWIQLNPYTLSFGRKWVKTQQVQFRRRTWGCFQRGSWWAHKNQVNSCRCLLFKARDNDPRLENVRRRAWWYFLNMLLVSSQECGEFSSILKPFIFGRKWVKTWQIQTKGGGCFRTCPEWARKNDMSSCHKSCVHVFICFYLSSKRYHAERGCASPLDCKIALVWMRVAVP